MRSMMLFYFVMFLNHEKWVLIGKFQDGRSLRIKYVLPYINYFGIDSVPLGLVKYEFNFGFIFFIRIYLVGALFHGS